MVRYGKVYGASWKSLWCVVEKSMVLKPGNPHKIKVFRLSKSRVNQVIKSSTISSNQSREQPTTTVSWGDKPNDLCEEVWD